jgi:hypothetical protein
MNKEEVRLLWLSRVRILQPRAQYLWSKAERGREQRDASQRKVKSQRTVRASQTAQAQAEDGSALPGRQDFGTGTSTTRAMQRMVTVDPTGSSVGKSYCTARLRVVFPPVGTRRSS